MDEGRDRRWVGSMDRKATRRAVLAGVGGGLITAGVGGVDRCLATQGATPGASPPTCPATTETENEALVRRYVDDVWNRQDLAALDTLLAADVIHHRGLGSTVSGVSAHRDRVAQFLGAFPDLRLAIEEVIAAGDRVLVRGTWRGTQRGEFLGLAPTNRQIEVSALLEFGIVCGQIAEMWFEVDNLGMFEQLGVITADELASVGTPTAATPTP